MDAELPYKCCIVYPGEEKPDWIKPMMLEIRITMSAVIGDNGDVHLDGVSSNLGFSSSRNIQSPRPMTQQAVSSVELAVGLLDVLAVRSSKCERDDKMTSTLIDDRCISHSLPHGSASLDDTRSVAACFTRVSRVGRSQTRWPFGAVWCRNKRAAQKKNTQLVQLTDY